VRIGRLGAGGFFGEQAVMARGNGLRRGVRVRTVVSRALCHFHVLHKRSLDELRLEIPALQSVLFEVEAGLMLEGAGGSGTRGGSGTLRVSGHFSLGSL